ncbi:hypothetical protein SAMN04489761_4010 [Tenacibaculum sp. MAR_2009_124]|uniref:hypothetical protein n=1 Tax=Tenacibaculum sp. MAR_2009_124 TaxID=1250059 RepID=UPI0008998780|nr:hypothetical protein [Tenacibaculum sp. MAR_2009_124]SEC93398.1 hypothetical protein SAMN04489761_4010 [Tenacibaculum sp. MAR_2009_124]
MIKLFKTLAVVLVSLTLIQCSNNKFDVSKGKVGKLTTKTTIQEIDAIFAKDSIVKILSEGDKGQLSIGDDDKYEVYEKGGKHLLTIVPQEQLDSTSTIKSIEIFDERFQTISGLNINSDFQQINANNKISKVETTFSSATLFIDDLNATISISKEDLGLKDFGSRKVSIDQIPDLAKIKSLTIWFN